MKKKNRNGERFEWDARKWKNVIDIAIKDEGVSNQVEKLN